MEGTFFRLGFLSLSLVYVTVFAFESNFVERALTDTNDISNVIKPCNSFYDCLDMAITRIQKSNRYKLVDGVWFTKLNNSILDNIENTSSAFIVDKISNVFHSHALFWNLAPGVNLKVYQISKNNFGMKVVGDIAEETEDKRTFGLGIKRRLQMALLPIMYKLGVITTLLVVLTVITLKGLTVGVILLVLSFGSFFAKLKGHQPYWQPEIAPQKNVHIHVHPFWKKQQHLGWHRNSENPDGLDYEMFTTQPPPWTYLPPKHFYPPSATNMFT